MSEAGTTWIEVSRSSERKTAEDHALVLEARGIASGVVLALDQHVVLVRVTDADRARTELANYLRENQERPTHDEPRAALQWSVGAALVYGAVLVGLDLASRRGRSTGGSRSRGRSRIPQQRPAASRPGLTRIPCTWPAVSRSIGVRRDARAERGLGLAWLAPARWRGSGSRLAQLRRTVDRSRRRSGYRQARTTGCDGKLTTTLAVGSDRDRRRKLAWLGGDGRIDANGMPRALGEPEEVRQINMVRTFWGLACLALGWLIGWSPSKQGPAWTQAALAAAAAGLVALAWVLALA